MKKIIYLHGLGSSGSTKTADYLRTKLPDTEVISPDIPLEPKLVMVISPLLEVLFSMEALVA